MEITENLANVLRNYKIKQKLSMNEMAQELEVAGSTLQDYLSGKGNPNIKTVEHIAAKMKLPPNVLLSTSFSNESLQMVLSLLELFSFVERMPQQKKNRFIQFLAEMLALWNDE